MFNRFAALGLLLIAMPAMQGCALVVAGGAAGATMVAMDTSSSH